MSDKNWNMISINMLFKGCDFEVLKQQTGKLLTAYTQLTLLRLRYLKKQITLEEYDNLRAGLVFKNGSATISYEDYISETRQYTFVSKLTHLQKITAFTSLKYSFIVSYNGVIYLGAFNDHHGEGGGMKITLTLAKHFINEGIMTGEDTIATTKNFEGTYFKLNRKK